MIRIKVRINIKKTIRVIMEKRYMKKRLYITLSPDEIVLLKKYAKNWHKCSLSFMIGKMIREYKEK